MIRIKICGVTTPSDAAAISDLGVDAIGLNFSPQSPRFVDPQNAWRIVLEMGPYVAPVGVFVGDETDNAYQITHDAGLRAIQTYRGDAMECEFGPTAHIPAFRIKDAKSLKAVQKQIRMMLKAGFIPAAILLDSFSDKAIGGTGHVAPWDLIAGFNPGVPVILAGGLTPENVGEAIRIVKPWGVDVASGVEKSTGVKDLKKAKAFIAAARAAASAL